MSRCNDAVTAADHFGPRGFRCKAFFVIVVLSRCTRYGNLMTLAPKTQKGHGVNMCQLKCEQVHESICEGTRQEAVQMWLFHALALCFEV